MTDYQNTNIEAASDEITLKELIVKVKEYFQEVKRNWFLVGIFCTLGVAALLYKYFTDPVEYKATMTFMVNSPEGGSGMAGAASILSSLGMGGAEKDNLDKILAMSKSMRIINETVLTKAKVDGEYDFLANHLIKRYEYHTKAWKKDPDLKDFLFKRSNTDSFSLIERKAIKAIFAQVAGSEKVEGLMSNSQSRQTQIMTMNVTTTSDELSVALTRALFETLSAFYIDKATQREKETFRLVKTKADSIKRALNGSDYAAAKFEDTHRGLFMETVKVPNRQLGRDVGRLTMMYGEAIKNLEMSDFALKNRTPYVQPIDEPFSPIKAADRSWKRAIIIGLALGGILGSLYVIIRKLLRESLS
ncbi:MAG: hypothetical protein RLZZ292_502 [Bacteroidota bacterium]|jgi:uncharacterized protein involved in exopolysaccharide biosynthesis